MTILAEIGWETVVKAFKDGRWIVGVAAFGFMIVFIAQSVVWR